MKANYGKHNNKMINRMKWNKQNLKGKSTHLYTHTYRESQAYACI